MRSRIATNKFRVTATSASWNVTLSPILTSFSRNVVSDQCLTSRGRTSRRKKLPRLYRRKLTALGKLAKLRCRVRRFKTLGQTLKKLFTPNIEKALTFLDNSQLPSTSNAVERGYRRHRKMQRSVYRVRTQKNISQRIAVDMQREEQSQGRLETITMLHNERIGAICSR